MQHRITRKNITIIFMTKGYWFENPCQDLPSQEFLLEQNIQPIPRWIAVLLGCLVQVHLPQGIVQHPLHVLKESDQ